MKPPNDAHDRAAKNQDDNDPRNARIDQREIDEVLADSFPASDAPPWTLGVERGTPKKLRQRKRHRREA